MEKQKKSLLFAAVVFSLFMSSFALAINDPVAHWKFDETSGLIAEDSAGDNDGTLVNGPVWPTGIIDGALQFDGADDTVNLGDDTGLKLPLPVTLSAWIKLDGAGTARQIITLDDPSLTHNGIWFGVKDTNNLTLSYGDGGSSDPSNRRSKFGLTTLQTGIWYHVIGIIRGPLDMEHYINGQLDDGVYSGTGGDLFYSNGDARIGSTGGVRSFFKGAIDDVRVYNRALSAQEIEELYLGEEPELVGLEITGPDEAAEDSQTRYSAIALYDNNSTADVTDEALWLVEPNVIADINAGLLTTEKIFQPEAVTITAQYSEDANTFDANKPVSVFAICPSGSALQFDGMDDYIEIPDSPDFTTNTISVAAWVKAPAQCDGRIASNYDHGPYQRSWTMYVGREGSLDKFCVSLTDTGEYYYGHRKSYETSEPIFDNTWHYVGFTFDAPSSSLKLYVDGIEDTNPTKICDDPITSLFDSSANVTIGCDLYYGLTCHYFKGAIDDVRIYDRVLSAEEIRVGMHTPLDGNEPNLVGYWDFDEGEGQVAHDTSGSGNDGQLGSLPDIDDSDPNWVDSDAPVGICTLEELVERNVNEALEIKLNILDELLEALAREDASVNILGGLFGRLEYGYLDKRDIRKAGQEIHSAIQSEEQAIHSVEKSVGDLEDSLDILTSDDGPPDSNSPNDNRLMKRLLIPLKK